MKQLFFILLMLTSTLGFAQEGSSVKWTFSHHKGNNPNEYVLVAKASIKEGFHVFSTDPGGDGLMIPTDVVLNDKSVFNKTGSFIPSRRPITKKMEGIGMVNYFEGDIEFTLTVETSKATAIEGVLTYQCCNDKMCFPPTDISFNEKL